MLSFRNGAADEGRRSPRSPKRSEFWSRHRCEVGWPRGWPGITEHRCPIPWSDSRPKWTDSVRFCADRRPLLDTPPALIRREVVRKFRCRAVNLQISGWASLFCKSVGVILRRFESCTCHKPKRGLSPVVMLARGLFGYPGPVLEERVLGRSRHTARCGATCGNGGPALCQGLRWKEYGRKFPVRVGVTGS
jgi:hypothetical protein